MALIKEVGGVKYYDRGVVVLEDDFKPDFQKYSHSRGHSSRYRGNKRSLGRGAGARASNRSDWKKNTPQR